MSMGICAYLVCKGNESVSLKAKGITNMDLEPKWIFVKFENEH